MKLSRLLFLVGISVLLISLANLAWLKLTDPAVFPIKSVKITANYSQVDASTLQQLALPFLNNNLITLDTDGLKQRLLQLPWVYQASVTRAWPDTLKIAIIEQEAVAEWKTVGLLNAAGDIFTPDRQSYPKDLPILSGPDSQQLEVLHYYQQMDVVLQPLNLKIVRVELNERQSWHLQLNNGITVTLGTSDPLPRLQRLAAAYPNVIGSRGRDVDTIDLRYTNGMAIHWRKT